MGASRLGLGRDQLVGRGDGASLLARELRERR